MAVRKIAITGGGPSGALCGERLARAGFGVTIYDEHLAWEKPCGGGLTHKAIVAYPFLLDNPYPKKLIRKVELISSAGHRARFEINHPIVIYSRTVLNGLLLERAAAAGCSVIRSRVSGLEIGDDGVRFHIDGGIQQSDFAVIASGARNSLLPGTRPLASDDMEMTMGYFVPSGGETLRVKFLQRFEGYIWSFPRSDHLSVGICGKLSSHTSQELSHHLHEFLRDEGISSDGARFYSHVLPSPQAKTLRQRRIAGARWALAGDAAAVVDPVTGEGLYYALRSGDLLAEALIAGQPESYPQRVREDFSNELEIAATIARQFYRGSFLGGAVATRMTQFVQRSAAFRALIGDVFSGAQQYSTLKARLWAQLGVTLLEVFQGMIRPGASLPRQTAGDA
jgi:flavin-dependent dehydrogenase